MIGLDYPKIKFNLFELELLEPMAIITDTLMGALSLFFAYKVSKMVSKSPFYRFWKLFFFLFGTGAILGGIGHTFYNQLGIPGKIPSWISGPLAIYFVERAMISVNPNRKIIQKLVFWSNIKLTIVYLIFFYLLFFVVTPDKPTIPFLPIAFNTIVGMTSATGVLAYRYSKKIDPLFKHFLIGLLVMLPTAFIFLFKVNLHQWFDKNDFSHVLFSIGLIYYYLGIFDLSKQKSTAHL